MKEFVFSSLFAPGSFTFWGYAPERVMKLQPVAGPSQRIEAFKGQLRVVENGALIVYASCLTSINREGVATFEMGVTNHSAS